MKFEELLNVTITGTNTDFSIVRENGVVHMINDVSIGTDAKTTVYRFDIYKGVVKAYDVLKPITHMDNEKFQRSFVREWYKRESMSLDTIANSINDIDVKTNSESAKEVMSNDDIETCVNVYNLILSRIDNARNAIESHKGESGDTVNCIVSAYRNENIYPNAKTALESMFNAAKKGYDTKADKESLKSAVNAFIQLFWRECENDGIMRYSCNVNNTMLRDIASVANGRHIVKSGYATRRNGSQKSVAGECVLAIIDTLQTRKENEHDNESDNVK